MNENTWKLGFTDDCKNPLKPNGEGLYLIIQNHKKILVSAIYNGL